MKENPLPSYEEYKSMYTQKKSELQSYEKQTVYSKAVEKLPSPKNAKKSSQYFQDL